MVKTKIIQVQEDTTVEIGLRNPKVIVTGDSNVSLFFDGGGVFLPGGQLFTLDLPTSEEINRTQVKCVFEGESGRRLTIIGNI